jgi:hypothetical protein
MTEQDDIKLFELKIMCCSDCYALCDSIIPHYVKCVTSGCRFYGRHQNRIRETLIDLGYGRPIKNVIIPGN